MKVLHLYPETDKVIARHVEVLADACSRYDDMTVWRSSFDVVPDIVHVHGCWRHAVVQQAERLHRQGSRIVLTPHDQLEPWIISERRLQEKLAKTIMWQRRLVGHSYVLIAHGCIEAEALSHLGWNPRTETIANAVITSTITPDEMARQTRAVYQKVLDSNTSELMTDDTHSLLVTLIKAGITGDSRWIEPQLLYEQQRLFDRLPDEEWRKLLLYADHEHIRPTVDAGIQTLQLMPPPIETKDIASYLPTDYQQPAVKANDVVGITAETRRSPLSMLHLVELARALRRPDVEDDSIADALAAKHLSRYFRRLLQLLQEETALDEGFMPLAPIDDKQTEKIRKLLKNHLRI